ncbi:MAG: phosphatidate cytidylyltransferase, partial [Cyanobacteria bacterium P01_H01_bin.35]
MFAFPIFGLSLQNQNVGMGWVIWLIVVVIATDIAGYFAGRRIGGAKFWPAVS